ncbi:MAG: DUF1206 domain-containing protein [Pseudomonadota bacterium]|nr:DUF1206 domain-containing protein [Pseudomonadota bacterium]
MQPLPTGATKKVASWIPPIARVGYAAKGLVYLLVGWIAIKAAMASGSPEGSTGALATLADEQGGRLMLTLIALGLLAHVIWRAVQALLDPEHEGSDADAKRVGVRLFYALSGLIYGSLAWTAWQLSRRGEGGAGDGHEVWVGRMLEKPLGTWLVMLAGIGVALYGAAQIYKAWKNDVSKRMTGGGPAVQMIGRVGTAARGFVLLPIGWFVFNAGRHYRAEQAADTEEVLKMLGNGGLLGVVGLGLLAYGVHQCAKAMYRRIERPA